LTFAGVVKRLKCDLPNGILRTKPCRFQRLHGYSAIRTSARSRMRSSVGPAQHPEQQLSH
jgi:hypothetical protein